MTMILGYLLVDRDRYVRGATSEPGYIPREGTNVVPITFRADLRRTAEVPGWFLAPDGLSLVPATQQEVNDHGENDELEAAKQESRVDAVVVALQAATSDEMNTPSLRAWAAAQLAMMRR